MNWRKCQDEFEKNVELYKDQGDSYRFKSGDDEQHTEWQDIMEDISTRMLECSGNEDVNADEKKSVEEDLKAAGELLRNKEVTRSTQKRTKPKSSRQTSYNTIHIQSGSSEEEGGYSKKLKPMDKLCLVLADHLQQNLKTPEPKSQELPNPPCIQQREEPAEQHYSLSQLPTLEDVLLVCGITSIELRQQYAQILVNEGFETPFLMLGLAGNTQMLIDIGFKKGHAIRLANLLLKVVNDTGFL